jgi:transposase
LLRGSFRPGAEIATLRAYLRQRERLVEYAAAHIQHMQKALMEMNLQLHHVVSDITGATGMRIIRAIVAGERDPDVLATYRDVRCHSSLETIRAALVGNDRDEHVFALTQSLELYDPGQDTRLRSQVGIPDGGADWQRSQAYWQTLQTAGEDQASQRTIF